MYKNKLDLKLTIFIHGLRLRPIKDAHGCCSSPLGWCSAMDEIMDCGT